MKTITLFLLMLLALALPVRAQSSTMTLGWTNDPAFYGITNYNVYWGTNVGVYPHELAAGNTNQFTVTGLTTNVTYYFVVTGVNGVGLESAYSTVATGTIYPLPVPPTGLRIIAISP